jgi:hypothetical protein
VGHLDGLSSGDNDLGRRIDAERLLTWGAAGSDAAQTQHQDHQPGSPHGVESRRSKKSSV